MKLSDLLDTVDLFHEIEAGFVRMRSHPHDPSLRILNYTEKAQYEKHWNDITRQCRGLIVRTSQDGMWWEDVIARPFDKFFNLGEHVVENFAPDALVQVADKMDGSLGILYPWPVERDDIKYAIATRGSFESEQAIHATDILRNRYPDFEPVPEVTYLFEIVYPENRIVLDYHGADDLFYLGARHIPSGEIYGPEIARRLGWQGPVTELLHNAVEFGDAIKQADRQNREGIVVRFRTSGLMVKIKQDDYVRLHKLVTGLNERAVWEHLSTHNGTYGELLADVPDEFHAWVEQVAEGFLDDFETLQGWAHVKYEAILDTLGFGEIDPADREYRKAFAIAARLEIPLGHSALLFQMLDGRDIAPAIWKTLKPKGETNSLMNRSEDNA